MPQDAANPGGDPILFLLFIAFIACGVYLALVSRRNRSITGKESMIGLIGEARTDLSPKGQVFLDGSFWNAVSVSGNIASGSEVEVVDMVGIKLKVKQAGSGPAPETK